MKLEGKAFSTPYGVDYACLTRNASARATQQLTDAMIMPGSAPPPLLVRSLVLSFVHHRLAWTQKLGLEPPHR